MNYQSILTGLEELTIETFGLWDHNRVGFQWRHYTLNHTLRVRNLCSELGKREGGDLTKLAFASTLHDITKRYDGAILSDENGKRVFDENGFWKNETLTPARSNVVTELYNENNLHGKVHSVSGAVIAKRLLEEYDVPEDFIELVGSIILAHVRPPNLAPERFDEYYGNVENRILYDADTIDPNVGYTAFYRNVHIHCYSAMRRGNFDLKAYASNLSNWVNTKYTFVDNLLTESGKEIGMKRQERNENLCAMLTEEIEDFQLNLKYGLLGMIDYLVSGTSDPHFREQMDYLEKHWIPERQKQIDDGRCAEKELAQQSLNRVVDVCNLMEGEYAGKI